ncbi:MAG: penicillin-binding protein 2 [Pseudomonadota bacterium]
MSFTRLKLRQERPVRDRSASLGGRRLLCLGAVFALSMGAVGLQLAELAGQKRVVAFVEAPAETSTKRGPRRDVVDRNGLPLALSVPTFELDLDTRLLRSEKERDEAAIRLAELLPTVSEEDIRREIALGAIDGNAKTRPIERPISPRLAQAAHDLGIPAISLTQRYDRRYVAGRATSHLLGYTDIDGVGQAGLEAGLENRLQQPASAGPLRLSVDMRLQTLVHDVLSRGVAAFDAEGAVGLIMDARTGEMLAMASLPDFDPGERPTKADNEKKERSRFFPRAAKGLYELGSVFKIFTWALAFEMGLADPDEVLDPPKSFSIAGRPISDLHPIREPVTVAEAFAQSSNIVAAQLMLEAGAPAQRRFFRALGFDAPTGLEMIEAGGARPVWADNWGDAATATAAYGHSISVTPTHLAAAVATILNEGRQVTPTLLAKDPNAEQPPQRSVISPRTSHLMRRVMRLAVTEGSGRSADVFGLDVGGKTGTAEQFDSAAGGYVDENVIASFVAAFPVHDPRYLVLVSFDQAEDRSGPEPVRVAGRNAAPVAAEIIARAAPLLRIVPEK